MNYEIQPEIWKDIKDYEDLYQISNLGNVERLPAKVIYRGDAIRNHKGCLLKPNILSNGYKYQDLSKDGIRKRYLVHRLVAIAFVPNPENKPEVNHKYGDKLDNRATELEWSTRAENNLHSFRVLGRAPVKNMLGKKGRLHHLSKPVVCINTSQQFECLTEAARELKIGRTTIREVLAGRRADINGLKFNYINQ
jgi:hypothetical protein